MSAELKFCGLTRAEDARLAASLGARYVGAIFAGGPRMISGERAAEVFASLPADVVRVGVFGSQSADEIARVVRIAELGVVQLHGEGEVQRINDVHACTNAQVWSVVRVEGGAIPERARRLAFESDGLLLDAYVAGQLGGTGVALPWAELAEGVERLREETRIILAGGLTPTNVAAAIAALSPDIVDVSSGVEDAPGIKNHDRMRAFRDAVVHAPIPT